MDRVEATGLSIAVIGHLFLLALLTLGLFNFTADPPSTDAIDVSFVEDVGLTSASPEPVQAPAPAMAPEAGPTEDAAPSPEASALPALRPEPPQPQPREAEPAPSPRRSEMTPRRRPEPARQAAPSRAAPPSRTGTGDRTRRSLIGDDILKGIGRDPSPSRSTAAPSQVSGQARASINAAIRRALLPCERQPLPAPEAAAIKVNVRVTLNPDGTLARAEIANVLNEAENLRIYERRMQDLALNIVRTCTPIRGLPADLYDVPRGWRQFTYQFDPR